MANVSYQSPPPLSMAGLSVGATVSLVATGQVVKSTAGNVHGWLISNTKASVVYVKLYNKATTPDQTDTPLLRLAVPAGTVSSVTLPFPVGFSAGIGWRATTGVLDNDNTGPSANEVVANLFYR